MTARLIAAARAVAEAVEPDESGFSLHPCCNDGDATRGRYRALLIELAMAVAEHDNGSSQ